MHLSIDRKISYVEPLSPADISGLRKDLKMVYINDIDVRDMDIQNIAKVMKNNMTNLTIGVEDTNKSINNTSDDDNVNVDDDIQTEEKNPVNNIEYIKLEKNKIYENIETDSVRMPSSSSQNINEKGL